MFCEYLYEEKENNEWKVHIYTVEYANHFVIQYHLEDNTLVVLAIQIMFVKHLMVIDRISQAQGQSY